MVAGIGAQHNRNVRTTKSHDTFTMSLFGLEVAAIRFVHEMPFGVSSFPLLLLGADVVLSQVAPATQLRHVTPEAVN
jgi:hypothetical protein